MSDDATRYVDELKREIEAETHRCKKLQAALGWSDSYRESAIQSLVAFEMAVMPIADSPPLVVAIVRSDLARAMRSVRRAGLLLKKLGAPTGHLAAALKSLQIAARSLPDELPKPKRRAL